MAQQTQVARVAERWRPFLARFPTPASLAEATAAEAVRWWSGLGYNRRALALHRAARAIVRDHGGRLPMDLDALLALPGIGPYTARAVLAFAFEADHGIVDTNTARVLARLEGRRLRAKEMQEAADRTVPATARRVATGTVIRLRHAVRSRSVDRSSDSGWSDGGRGESHVPAGSISLPRGACDNLFEADSFGVGWSRRSARTPENRSPGVW